LPIEYIGHDKLMSPCEEAVRNIIPAIKAALAITLCKRYDYSVNRAAKLLGLTPTAVSNYLNMKRGGAYVRLLLTIPELHSEIEEFADAVVALRQKGYPISMASMFLCRICRDIKYYLSVNKISPEEYCPIQNSRINGV
jgi:predicted transcriptional regulator